MLDDKIYKEYLSLENQRRVQEQEQKQQEKERRRQEKKAGKKSGGSKDETQTQQEAFDAAGPEADGGELDEMIAEGQSCIKRLREMNDNIPGEEISAKLFRLENILREIFTGLKEHPEQAPQMRKFMNYYLPTTLKLVEAYEDFESVSSQGEEIREAKAEIEKTLDSINSAFEELLNRMFRDTAYDVTTDAQVLQSMLAREGLTRQRELEFEKVPR